MIDPLAQLSNTPNSLQDEANYGKGKIGGDRAGYEPGGKAK